MTPLAIFSQKKLAKGGAETTPTSKICGSMLTVLKVGIFNS